MKASVRSSREKSAEEARQIIREQLKSEDEVGGKVQRGEATDLNMWNRGEVLEIWGIGHNLDDYGVSIISAEFTREELVRIFTFALKEGLVQLSGVADLIEVKSQLESATKTLAAAMQKLTPSV